ncbi:MAG: cation transporter [Psychroserpens sp.]|uniref:heavy-metal-associated domain-containing protein n=1 Tax=Psychroserpens sp. TaxID=2020870 RepID=UPI003C8D62BE
MKFLEKKHKINMMNDLSKRAILSLALVFALGLTSCKNEEKAKTETETETNDVSKEVAMAEISFGVRGNCGMCKTTIEKAANGVNGVTNATWDVDKKKIDVSFDDSKTDAMSIHKAIAASGYDTEKAAGDLEAYNDLPGCCKYDHDMEMNQ